MTSIAEIGIRVDSTEAAQAADNLDKMTEAGKRSEDSVKRTGKAWEQAIGGMATDTQRIVKELQTLNTRQDATAKMMADIGRSISSASSSFQSAAASMGSYRAQNDALAVSQDKAAKSAEQAAKATKQQASDLSDLLGKIDPTTAALGRLADMEKRLTGFKDSGALDGAAFDQYKAKLDQTRAGLAGFDDSLNRTGMSAAATAAALRSVPAQFTDIFTSLQGGQAPMTVLIQQGGQLKDMFGGIAPAAQALGGYVASLITPFTLAAAAAVALGVAYYKGAEESTRYKEALILTGNAAGTSADSLAAMASKVGETVGTTSKAADVLAQMAGSGKIASSSFEEVATAALQMQEATGRAVADTVAEFVKIGKDPVAAAKELNDQYGFLTASVYAQIVSLKEQGREQEAVKLLTDTYADTVETRSRQVIENLNLWQRAWNGIKSAAGEALSGLASVGRESTLSEQLEGAEARLAELTAGGRDAAKEDPFRFEEATKEIARLKLALHANALNAATEGLRGQNQKEAMAGIDLINKEADAAATNVEKLNKRLADLDKARAKNVANDSWSSGDQAKYEKSAAALRKQIADDQEKAAKSPRTAVDLSGFNAAQNQLKLIVSEYQNSQQKLDAAQKNGLLSQKDYSEQSAALVEKEKGRISAAYQAEIDALEAAKGRKSTSAEQRIALDQKIADARANMVKAEQDFDTKLNVISANEEGRLRKQAAAVQTYVDALNDQLATTKKQLELSVAGVGMGDEARRRLQEDIKIQQEYQDKLDKLLSQKNRDQIDGSVYEQETAAVRKALAERLDLQKDYYSAVEAEQSNWLNGASSAYETYLEQVKSVSGQTKSAFTKAFTGLEDVLVSFVTSGKASFKDFADSIIADIARIAIKSKVMPVVLGSLGLASSPGASAGALAGSGGSGGMDFETMLSAGKTLYNVSTSGFGGAVSAGWNAGEGFMGGMQGAISNGSSYVTSGISNLFGGSSTAASSAAQGATQAGYTGSQMANWSAAQTNGTWGGAAGGFGAVAGGIGGAIQGYQNSGFKGAVAGGLGGWGGATAGTIAGTAAASALSGTAMGATLGSVLPGIGTVIGAALGAAVGSKLFAGDWVTKDQGIQLGVEDGDFEAQGFEYQKKKGGLFGKNKKRTKLTALDPEMQAALDTTYEATAGKAVSLFERLNVEMNEGVLDGLNVASTQISTQGRTQEEIQALFTDFFNQVGNSAVNAIADATGTQLDPGTTLDGLNIMVNNLFTINDALELVNVGLIQTSVYGMKMANQLQDMAGGMEAFTKNTSGYYENFFSDTEKADDTLAAVGKQFAALNVAFPASREGFRDVVEAIDVQTEAGRQMYVTMMGLSESAASAYTILEQRASEAEQAAAAAAQAIIDGLMSAASGASGAVQRAIAAEQKAATEAYNARITSLNDMASTARDNVSGLTGVSNDLSSALKALRGDSDGAVKMLREQARATVQSALATARAGGSLADFTGLSDALDTLGSNNADLYGSMVDFQRDQGRAANAIAELDQLNGKQLSTAEQTVKALEEQLKQAKQSYDDQMAQFDKQLAFAQAQMDAINGVDNSVMNVTAAIEAMNASVVAALGAISGNATTATPTNNGTLIDTVYKELLGRDADAKGKQYWLDQLSSGAITRDQLPEAIANAARENDQTVKPGYATGGLVSGPGTGTSDSILARLSNGEYVLRADAVRTYGTDLLDQMNAGDLPKFAGGGPVVRNYNTSQTAATLKGSSDSGATNAELRRQLAEIYSGLAIMNKHMEKTAYNTAQMNQGGVQVVNTVKTEAV